MALIGGGVTLGDLSPFFTRAGRRAGASREATTCARVNCIARTRSRLLTTRLCVYHVIACVVSSQLHARAGVGLSTRGY